MLSLPVTVFSEHMDAMMALNWLGLPWPGRQPRLDRVNSQVFEMFIR
jgi:hypothetical protein